MEREGGMEVPKNLNKIRWENSGEDILLCMWREHEPEAEGTVSLAKELV